MSIQGSENGFVLWLLGAKAEVVLPSLCIPEASAIGNYAGTSRPVTLLHYSYSAFECLNSEGSRANSTTLFHRRVNRLRETCFVQSPEW